MAEHKNLTDPELHEPKGVAAASAGQVYVADGASSGSWATLDADNVSVTDSGGYYSSGTLENVLQELGPKVHYLTQEIWDISTAQAVYFPIPEDCVINSVTTILRGAIATADATITVSRGGDSAVLGTLTVAYSGSAEGDVDENSSLSNNTVTKATHKYIKVATDGASTNTIPLYVLIKLTA